MALRLISTSCTKMFDSYFLDMMYEFMKNFLLAVEPAWLLDSLHEKFYFLDMMYVEFIKIFFSPIRAS